MTPEYEIQKNIPIPEIRRVGKYVQPLKALQVGESFWYKADHSSGALIAAKRMGLKIVTRKELDGFRVWRVK